MLLNRFSSMKAALAIHAGIESAGSVLEPRALESALGVRFAYLGATAPSPNASELCAAVPVGGGDGDGGSDGGGGGGDGDGNGDGGGGGGDDDERGGGVLRVRVAVLGWRRLASLQRLIGSPERSLLFEPSP